MLTTCMCVAMLQLQIKDYAIDYSPTNGKVQVYTTDNMFQQLLQNVQRLPVIFFTKR